MELYISWVKSNPMLSAAVQFGLLGTLGEYVSSWFKTKKFSLNCTWLQLILKIIAWAFLGLIIKYGFIGMKGFAGALVEGGLVPSVLHSGLGLAFLISVITNILFGPQMMLFHRLEENLIMKSKGYEGMEVALKSLIWFWIPAHTITFALPKVYQIGLAACWSVVLGVILGLATPVRNDKEHPKK
jgi:hypothetical protein